MMAKNEIWTIGYGGRKPADFVALLREAGVQLVADVRMSPRSALGSFSRAQSDDRGIQKLLAGGGIGYEWLPELGNPDRGDPEMLKFRTLVVPEFSTRTKRLVELATAQHVCLLCGCKLPTSCHRTVVADWLTEQGWQKIEL